MKKRFFWIFAVIIILSGWATVERAVDDAPVLLLPMAEEATRDPDATPVPFYEDENYDYSQLEISDAKRPNTAINVLLAAGFATAVTILAFIVISVHKRNRNAHIKTQSESDDL